MNKSVSHRIIPLAVTILAAIFILGCGSGKTPLTPDTDPLTRDSRASDTASNRMLWGFYTVSIDPDTLEVEIIPVRGAMFTANVTQFMQPPISPINMLSIAIDPSESDFDNFYFVVDITLRHPFPGMMQFRGFDVRGIFMSDAWRFTDIDHTAFFPDWYNAAPGVPANSSVLLNADGYTRWWNPNEFTTYDTIFGYTDGAFSAPGYISSCTISPFKYFADGLGPDDPFDIDVETRGTYSVNPGINTRRYEIQFNGVPLQFNYAIGASWDPPDPSGAPDYDIDSFPTSANCQEAYKLSISSDESDVWYESPDSYGGTFIVEVEVFDWQAVGATGNPSTVMAEIDDFWIESNAFAPGGGIWIYHYIHLMDGPDELLPGVELLPGSTDTSAIFRIEVEPDFDVYGIDSAGEYQVLIVVESSVPGSYKPQIDGGLGYKIPSSPLSAYGVGTVTVLPENPVTNPEVILVFEDETIFDPANADTTMYAPSICVENSGKVTFVHGEWVQEGTYSWSWTVARRSDNDGDSWDEVKSSFQTTGSGRLLDTIKTWAATHDISYKTMNVGPVDGSDIFLGSTNSNFPGPWEPGYEVASQSHNCDYANEIVQDDEGYVYLFGDEADIIRFKRSPNPECLNCGPPPPPPYSNYTYVQEYYMIDPGRLSWVRSTALHDDVSYLAYFDPIAWTIRLAKSTSDWTVWDTSTVIWDDTGSGTSGARDPGLWVDDSGFFVSFLREDDASGNYQLCFTYSSDGDTWTEPVVVRDSEDEITNSPVCHYIWEDLSVPSVVWCENEEVWTSFSVDGGQNWCDPVSVPQSSAQYEHPDFIVAPSGNWHFVYAIDTTGSEVYNIAHRRAHLEFE